MKLIAVYSPSHAILADRHFLPSVPAELTPEVRVIERAGDGDYGTQNFWTFMVHKLDLMRDAIRNNPGDTVLFADVDIVFLGPVKDDLLRELAASGADILFQREGLLTADINCGFFVMRCNERTQAFFDRTAAALPEHDYNDQATINLLLPDSAPLRWGYLPWRYSAGSHGFPPPADALIYHANDTAGRHSVRQKIEHFTDLRRIRKYGAPAELWCKARRKLRRMFAQSH